MIHTARAPSLLQLDTYDDDKNVLAGIETPKGTRTKLAFDSDRDAFVVEEGSPGGDELSV